MGLEETFAKACEVMGAEKGYCNEKLVYNRTPPLVLFTGSRDWEEWHTIEEVLITLRAVIGPFKGLHGGAPGLDTMVDNLMRQRCWDVENMRPRYGIYHPKVAPKKRNIEMLERHPDLVIGFWTGSKGGTTHCLEWAINVYRIPTMVITA